MATWTEPASTVEAYMVGLSDFARPVVERLRRVIRDAGPDLDEAIRWNAPSYKGKLIVCGFAAFQKHVLLTFSRGAELHDPKGLLAQGQGRTAMRSAKFTALDQVDERMVHDWVTLAVNLDATGETVVRRPPVKEPEPTMPGELQRVLNLRKNGKAKATYEGLSPSARREYCEWIASAKKEETLLLRVAKSLEKLLDGEGLNDSYRA